MYCLKQFISLEKEGTKTKKQKNTILYEVNTVVTTHIKGRYKDSSVVMDSHKADQCLDQNIVEAKALTTMTYINSIYGDNLGDTLCLKLYQCDNMKLIML